MILLKIHDFAENRVQTPVSKHPCQTPRVQTPVSNPRVKPQCQTTLLNHPAGPPCLLDHPACWTTLPAGPPCWTTLPAGPPWPDHPGWTTHGKCYPGLGGSFLRVSPTDLQCKSHPFWSQLTCNGTKVMTLEGILAG